MDGNDSVLFGLCFRVLSGVRFLSWLEWGLAGHSIGSGKRSDLDVLRLLLRGLVAADLFSGKSSRRDTVVASQPAQDL